MAFSQIKLTFTAIPDIDESLSIGESKLGLNLLEIFKITRDAAAQVTLPSIASFVKEYNWNISGITEDTFVTLQYTDAAGISQTISDYVGNLGSDYLFNAVEGEYTNTHGSVSLTGINDQVLYAGFVSDNYRDAFDLDYNTNAFFAISSTQGSAGTGLGTVTIIAAYPNATFEVLSNTAPVTFEITNNVDTTENRVLPMQLSFQVFPDVANAPSQSFSIQTPDNWSIAAELPSWLELSAVSGTGNASVSATPVNYEALAAGNYTTDLNVVLGAKTFVVTVFLSVFSFVRNPFSPGKLYFTQELEYLSFGTATAGTFVALYIEIKVFAINTYEPIIYTRPYNFPLFKGKGNFHVGSIVHELFEEIQELTDFVPDLKSNYTKPQYRPAEITVSFEEKTFGATVPGLVSGSLPMFKMAKGNKPFSTESQLILLTTAQQEVTRITPHSFVGTSFVYFGTPRIIVKKNNKIIDDFEITEADPNKVIFSYFRFVNDVKAGDSLELIIVNGLETRSQRFLVFQNGMENTYFFFENDNQMLEPYEFSGRRRMSPNFKHVTTRKFKDLYSFDSKVKTDLSQSFIINTGQLAKADYLIIMAIVGSTKVWCSFDNPAGPYFKVDATTTKLTTQDTSSSEDDFNIEFNILENAHASIYPR